MNDSPYWLAFNQMNGYIYTTNQLDRIISVIDGLEESVIENIELLNEPYYIIFNPSNNKLYLTEKDVPFISVINSTIDIEKQIDINTSFSMAYNPTENNIYITQPKFNRVEVLNSSDIISDSIPIKSPYAIAHNPSNNGMYVTEINDNFVSVINTTNNQVSDRILVGKGPNSIAYNPVNDNIYVTHRYSDTISIIDNQTNAVITSITLDTGATIMDIKFNPGDNNMYVASNSGIYIIDSLSNKIIGKDFDSANAFALVFNPLDGKMYHSHPQENYVGSTSILELPKAVCPIEYTQHWNSITFKILSPVLAKIADLPVNTSLVLNTKSDSGFASFQQQIINKLFPDEKGFSEFQKYIEVIDSDYSISCSENVEEKERDNNDISNFVITKDNNVTKILKK